MLTDHLAVTLELRSSQNTSKDPSHWKFNTSLLTDNIYTEKIVTLINECKSSFENINNPCLLWEYLKFRVREFTINYSKKKARIRKEKKYNLENEFIKLESKLANNNNPEIIIQDYIDVRTQLEDHNKYLTEGAILRSKCRYFEEGEKNSKYFLSLEKQNKRKTSIKKLIIDGIEVSDLKKIL